MHLNQLNADTLNAEAVSNFIVLEVHMNILGICPECAEQLEGEKCNEY